MSESITRAEVRIKDLGFTGFVLDDSLTQADVDGVLTYEYNLTFDRRTDEAAADREVIACSLTLTCANPRSKELYQGDASVLFSLRTLARHQVDENLLSYLADTCYQQLQGYFFFQTENTLLSEKQLPFIDFKANTDIKQQLDELWG